jgi:hypothetical protein
MSPRSRKLLNGTHGFRPDGGRSGDHWSTCTNRFSRSVRRSDYSGGVKGLTTGNTNFAKLAAGGGCRQHAAHFLGTDEAYQAVPRAPAPQSEIVPVQADFARPKALRAVGDFLRTRGLRVSAFYISNVEQYLFNPRSPTAPAGRKPTAAGARSMRISGTLPADGQHTVLLRVPVGPGSVNARGHGPSDTARWNGHDGAPARNVPFCPLLTFLECG